MANKYSFACTVIFALAVCAMAATGEDSCPTGNVVRRLVDAPTVRDGFGVWPSTPPEDCPFPQSESFSGVEFTGRHGDPHGRVAGRCEEGRGVRIPAEDRPLGDVHGGEGEQGRMPRRPFRNRRVLIALDVLHESEDAHTLASSYDRPLAPAGGLWYNVGQ